jgi:hypothetical protein
MTSWGSWTRRCSCTSTMAMAAMPPRSSMNNGVSAQETYKIAGQSNLVQLIPVYFPFPVLPSQLVKCKLPVYSIKCQLKLLGLICFPVRQSYAE